MNRTPQTMATEPGQATPACPHFGPCGGCQLQNVTYPAQLALKADRLRTSLTAANLALPKLQLHPSPPLAYRNRIRLTLAEADGRLRAGYLSRPIDLKSGCPTTGFSDVGFEAAQTPKSNPQSAPPAFLPITQCPIAAPILWRAAKAFLALIDQTPGPWLRNPQLKPDQLELFTTADESCLQLTLYLRTSEKSLPAKDATAFTALCDELAARIPSLSGAGVALLPAHPRQHSRRAEQPRPGPTWGAPGLNYTISTQDESVIPTLSERSEPKGKNPRVGAESESVILSGAKNPRISPLPLPALQPATNNQQPTTSLPLPVPQPATNNQQPATSYWVPRGAFFQINRFLLPELLDLVTAGRTGALAWDLYAGVGLFTSALAPHFTRITAVEIAEPAFTALASTRLANRHAVKSTTLDFLRTAVFQRDRPDLIVLDPPRTGAGPEVCALLARIAAPTLIYVACSPETLPADIEVLAAAGYRVAELHLLDLFPQTTHIETVAILTR